MCTAQLGSRPKVFYPTHQFFLTGNSLYIIAFNLLSPNWERVEYWLQTVQQLGAKSPVIAVGTHLGPLLLTSTAVGSNLRR